jgi:eukaryotic-like serine/threonine-protein kinase
MISPGTTLGGRYRLEERIASGGMGDVWRAVDDVLGRTVAVKILLPSLLDEQGFTERFRVEARTMATINHAGVVDIYDYGSDDAVGAYLVMEYVEGDALSRTLARVGRLTPARTMALVAQAADALHAAHVTGVVHRDVKPGNLLVRPNGTLVLTDFGIARSAGAAQLTAAGSVLGTASYISPEQAMGQSATALSDIYALGVVAYQCLAGRRPFEGDNPLEIAMRHVRENPPPLPPDIPPNVRQIVDRAMAKDPGARWQNAAEFAAVARRAAGALAAAARTGATAPTVPAGPMPRPVSGGQLTPTPTPLPVGGPRVMSGSPVPGHPGTGYPVLPYPPGSGAVPVQPGLRQEYLRGPVPVQTQQPHRTGLVVALVIAVLVLAVCAGVAIALFQNSRAGGLGRPDRVSVIKGVAGSVRSDLASRGVALAVDVAPIGYHGQL